MLCCHLNDLHANIPQLFHHGGGGQFIGDHGPHFLQVQAGIGANDAHLGVVGQDEVAVGVAEHGLIDAQLRGDAAQQLSVGGDARAADERLPGVDHEQVAHGAVPGENGVLAPHFSAGQGNAQVGGILPSANQAVVGEHLNILAPQEVQQPQGGAAAVDEDLIVFCHQIGGVLADEIPVQLHLVGVSGGGDGLLRHSAAVETANEALVLQVL